jgi:hypothetical protein
MLQQDIDPQETREWLEALDAVVEHDGPGRAQHLLERVVGHAQLTGAAPAQPAERQHQRATTHERLTMRMRGGEVSWHGDHREVVDSPSRRAAPAGARCREEVLAGRPVLDEDHRHGQ